MSSQMQRPYAPQPPLMGNPNISMGQPQAQSHSHSNSSFMMVFIVLAIIGVISVIACCLGRCCNRRLGAYTGPKQSKQAHSTAHHGQPRKKRGDKFRFDEEKGHENPELDKQNTPVNQGSH